MSNYYTSSSLGNNGNPGTLVSPFATVAYSLSMMTYGDTLYIAPETFNETGSGIIPSSGITVIGDYLCQYFSTTSGFHPSFPKIYKAGAASFGFGDNNVSSKHYFTLKNVALYNWVVGVLADGIANNWLLQRVYTYNTAQEGIRIDSMQNSTIDRCLVDRAGTGSTYNGIYVLNSANINKIYYTEVTGATNNGIASAGDFHIEIKGCYSHHNTGNGFEINSISNTNFLYENNVSKYNGAHGVNIALTNSNGRYRKSISEKNTGCGFYLSQPDGIIIEKNIIRKNYSHGILVYHNTYSANDNKIYNNIIDYNVGSQIYTQLEYTNASYNLWIYNNTIVESGNSKKAIDFTGGTYPQYLNGAKIKNNIIYNAGGSSSIGVNCYGTSYQEINTNMIYGFASGISNGNGINILYQDPQFTDINAGNFEPVYGSPAINNGLILAQISKDFNDNNRPASGYTTMGAYEYVVNPLAYDNNGTLYTENLMFEIASNAIKFDVSQTTPAGTTIDWSISYNNGSTYSGITTNTWFSVPTNTWNAKFRAVMASNDIYTTPEIDSYNLYYKNV